MNKIEKNSLLQIIAELFFVLLPLVVIFIILSITGKKATVFKYSDFSFAAIVLFGQTVVKFTSGAAKNNKRKKWQIISIVTSSIIVFGIIPTTTILIKIFESVNLPNWVYGLQFLLFLIAVTVFIIIGTVGQMYLDEDNA